MNDEPPMIVPSIYRGDMPRYSARFNGEVRLWVRGADEAVDILQREPAIVERAGDALGHQVDDDVPWRDLADIALGRPDDCRAAALEAAHDAPPTAVKTG